MKIAQPLPSGSHIDFRSHPNFGLTHINRINDWEGSDSYIGPANVVELPVEDTSELHPYKLLTKGTDSAGVLRQPGDIVHIHVSQVGPHHQKLPDHEYPAVPEKIERVAEWPGGMSEPSRMAEMMGLLEASRARLMEVEKDAGAKAQKIADLEKAAREAEGKIANLEADEKNKAHRIEELLDAVNTGHRRVNELEAVLEAQKRPELAKLAKDEKPAEKPAAKPLT
jgi:hypothetical protein